MEKEEKKINDVIKVYTEIMRKTLDKKFEFSHGGKPRTTISKFISYMVAEYGDITAERIVDYCVFQIHKNRTSQYLQSLSINSFGKTGFNKFVDMSNKSKKYSEDMWLKDSGLSRDYLRSLIEDETEHPQSKYVYMQSEEITKQRFLGSNTGFYICIQSTLLWSPFSETCNKCANVEKCKIETERRYPELYRIRTEEYAKTQR